MKYKVNIEGCTALGGLLGKEQLSILFTASTGSLSVILVALSPLWEVVVPLGITCGIYKNPYEWELEESLENLLDDS